MGRSGERVPESVGGVGRRIKRVKFVNLLGRADNVGQS